MPEELTDDERFTTWCEWFETIHQDVRVLFSNRKFFREIEAIIEASPKRRKLAPFYIRMGRLYGDATLMGIRRQLDRREDSVSLARLLAEIHNWPSILSRERYMSRYKRRSSGLTLAIPEPVASEEFDLLVRQGKPYVDSTVVKADLAELQSKTAKLKEFATKRLAHMDEEVARFDSWYFRSTVSFQEIDDSLDLLRRLLLRYFRFFSSDYFLDLEPIWTHDWKAIFGEPWITPDLSRED